MKRVLGKIEVWWESSKGVFCCCCHPFCLSLALVKCKRQSLEAYNPSVLQNMWKLGILHVGYRMLANKGCVFYWPHLTICMSLFPCAEIPVFPTVTAKVTFQQFSWEDDVPSSQFVIPMGYREDPYRFPDLWYLLELTLVHILSSQTCLGCDPDTGQKLLGIDVPLTNFIDSSAQMTLIF